MNSTGFWISVKLPEDTKQTIRKAAEAASEMRGRKVTMTEIIIEATLPEARRILEDFENRG